MTLRARDGLRSLRGTYGPIRRAVAKGSKTDFRILQFSVQHDHVHLLVEAVGRTTLSRGLQGLAIRLAKTVNRVLGRSGKVWEGRYHVRALRTPREVRNALVYVLQNWRKHIPAVIGLDPCSSASWFTGWSGPVPTPSGNAPIARARTWLASIGWRRWGLIAIDERPAMTRRQR